MPKTAIHIENLYKEYRLGVISHGTLAKDIQSWWARIRGKEDPNDRLFDKANWKHDASQKGADRFWALEDVSLDIKQGESVGIIGANGAGKSTLLKVLSRITAPTHGRIGINGRIASLLEVGTGFHPELTGRENVFLNGAIMGVGWAEIRQKFDSIAEFSGLAEFLDTPVKRYSSGMYVRLAFAVAAHLEPDILVVDEVLAVGDLKFRQKCLGKMQDVVNTGRTVLFVSHNLDAITQLCDRSVLLEQGRVVEDGPTQRVVARYQQSGGELCAKRQWDAAGAPGDDSVRLRGVRVRDASGKEKHSFSVRESIHFEMDYEVLKDDFKGYLGFRMTDSNGRHLFVSGDYQDADVVMNSRRPGAHRLHCDIPGDLLNAGTVTMVAIARTEPLPPHYAVFDCIVLKIVDEPEGGARGGFTGDWPRTSVRPLFPWRHEKITG